jgi:hypothetical protein
MHDRYGSHGGDPPRHGPAPAGHKGAAVGTGYLGLETDDGGHRFLEMEAGRIAVIVTWARLILEYE